MPRLRNLQTRSFFRLFWTKNRRESLIALLQFWNRSQMARIGLAVLAAWVLGVLGIHLSERGGNPAFDSWSESFWSVWLILFSGVENAPRTWLGRFFAMIAGERRSGCPFTGTVAWTQLKPRCP